TISSKTAVKRWVLRRTSSAGSPVRSTWRMGSTCTRWRALRPSRTMKAGTMGASVRSAIRAMPPLVLAGSPETSTNPPTPRGEPAGAPLPADRLLPPRLALEADHVPQPLVREPRQMGQLGGHAAEVKERASQDAPPLTEGPLGEGDAQVHHADPPVGHVERVGQERAQLTQAERQGERQGAEQPHHDAQRQVLHARAHPSMTTLWRESRPRPGPPPRRA